MGGNGRKTGGKLEENGRKMGGKWEENGREMGGKREENGRGAVENVRHMVGKLGAMGY